MPEKIANFESKEKEIEKETSGKVIDTARQDYFVHDIPIDAGFFDEESLQKDYSILLKRLEFILENGLMSPNDLDDFIKEKGIGNEINHPY
ncbi:MAG: hypothetical protein M1127_01110, partial [Patescibacteria group bacterium]|nr:hypothetical protein [Patescibacteria group bacterium]